MMYDELFLSPEIALSIVGASKDVVGSFLTKALSIEPRWTTTRCAVTVEQLCGEAMVAAGTAAYNTAFLYSLALASETDPGTHFELSDKQAVVAFRLAKAWKTRRPLAAAGGPEHADPPGDTAGAAAGGVAGLGAQGPAKMDKDEETEDEASPLPWEDSREDLPADLQQVSARFTSGTLSMEPRQWLEELPRWDGVKDKPELNNHRTDKEKVQDRVLRSLQAKVLGLQRVYPCLHSCIEDPDGKELGQKFWALLMAFEKDLVNQRKLNSIPHTVPPSEPVLFSQEDLEVNRDHDNINKVGFGKGYGDRKSVV